VCTDTGEALQFTETHFEEYSPSSEAYGPSVVQEILHLLWNTKVHHMNPFHVLTNYLFETYSSITPLCTSRSLKRFLPVRFSVGIFDVMRATYPDHFNSLDLIAVIISDPYNL
jgi:hypothetical protein